MPLRVLMVSDDYLPNPGGIAAHVHELARELALGGHRVDLLVGHDRRNRGGPVPALPPGARVVRNRPFAWSPAGYAATAVETALLIRRLRREAPYDLCHWHSLVWESWGVLAGAGGLPRVFTNHSSGFLRRMRSPLRRRAQLRAILSIADEVIAPSVELREQTVRAGVAPERVTYVPNGVDAERFRPGPADPELLARYGLSAEDRVVVAPRRLEHKNGLDVLIRALPGLAERVGRARLLLVGDGPERAELERLARSLGVAGRVVFCGSQPRAAMPGHLRLGQVAALPSRAEAVSLAGLEAMATGLPVVGSRVGGIPAFVEDGLTGRLVAPEDPAALAAALADLLGGPEAALGEMGDRARGSVAERFSWRLCAERTVGVYEAALGRGRGG